MFFVKVFCFCLCHAFMKGLFLGKEFCEIYADAKMEEWDNYMEQVSQWELDEYLYRI